MTDKWNPEDHRAADSKYFEDLEIGERYPLPSRTQTSGLFSAFQASSGDNDPIHYDVEYCKRRNHRDLLAHGMQVLNQTAAGAGPFPQVVRDSLVGMIEINAKFVKAVYREDTLYPMLEITELKEQNTTGVVTMAATVRNQDGVVVLEGTHKYLIRKRNG